MNINKKFGNSVGLGLDRLQTSLVNSRIQDSNPALFQTIQGMIAATSSLEGKTEEKLTDKSIIPADKITGLPIIDQNIYLPVLTDVANIDTSSAYYTWWTRVGNIITVWGKITANATVIDTDTQIRMSLPFPSAFQHEEQLSGTINGFPPSGATANIAGICKANPADFDCVFEYYASNTEDNDLRFIFSYLMIAK